MRMDSPICGTFGFGDDEGVLGLAVKRIFTGAQRLPPETKSKLLVTYTKYYDE